MHKHATQTNLLRTDIPTAATTASACNSVPLPLSRLPPPSPAKQSGPPHHQRCLPEHSCVFYLINYLLIYLQASTLTKLKDSSDTPRSLHPSFTPGSCSTRRACAR
jgi:hypothetical protein